MGGYGQELVSGAELRLSFNQRRLKSGLPGHGRVPVSISFRPWTAVVGLLFFADPVSVYPHNG
jgi:hypothetical protein